MKEMLNTSINYGIMEKHFGSIKSMNQELKINSNDIIDSMGSLNERFSGKNILLTGAAGFLGCQFIHYFKILNGKHILDKPCHLYAWDNYLLGKPDWLNQLQNRSDLSVCDKDVTKNKKFPEIIDWRRVGCWGMVSYIHSA